MSTTSLQFQFAAKRPKASRFSSLVSALFTAWCAMAQTNTGTEHLGL